MRINLKSCVSSGRSTLTFVSFMFVAAPLAANEPGAAPYVPPPSSGGAPGLDQYCTEAARPCLSGPPLLSLKPRESGPDARTGFASGLELGEQGPLRLKFTGKRIKLRFAF